MFDTSSLPPSSVSVLEARLAQRLREHRGEVWLIDCPPHGQQVRGKESAAVQPGTPRPEEEADHDDADHHDGDADQDDEEFAGPEFAALARLLEAGADELDTVRNAELTMRRAAVTRARALTAFARQRPEGRFDRQPGETGAMSTATRAGRPAALTPVSEWAVDEVAATLRISTSFATTLLVEAITLVEQLPATLAAVEVGRISWAHAGVLAEELATVENDETRADIEQRLLARADSKTIAQLRTAAVRAVVRHDAEGAAKRALKALRDRQVRYSPGKDGMGALTATLATPVGRACYDALERYADLCVTENDARTKSQRMADCLADLILRPGEHGMPPVQAQLTLVAGVDTALGGDEPGEVDGDLIPAALFREICYTLGLLPRPTTTEASSNTDGPRLAGVDVSDEAAAQMERTGSGPVHRGGGTEGSTTPADATPDDVEATSDAATTDDADATGSTAADIDAGGEEGTGGSTSLAEACRLSGLTDLFTNRRTGGTALAELPHLALVDAFTGSLLALTDTAGLRAAARAGTGLGPPPDSPGYRPGQELDRFVRLRDRRCRFPGCRARPRRCDLDHTRPYPDGPTSHTNLCCLCEHHHRLSHQAPGWRLRATPDGGLEWTLPSGKKITTYPPRYGADDDLSPDAPPFVSAAPPAPPADDPPPF